ncbi:MmyB family transcriptional regulator [Streptomyces fuscichromogenes]|uniref:MmyB-like transcription regulator ligand binding domain-containing protein n=1 Tax=Streptomyces fuscichromogenes TaxID=1324013 RepID=A0A917XA96_9ACTN|nr:hypothetical protein [Streptomyces fuscichromogenes]GGN00497.1 hypothetical protein GCM10011578_022220 [Streptomyces fuscichromogenes]
MTSLGQPEAEVSVVSDLRRASGRFQNSERPAGLIRDLTKCSPRFAELWASGLVGAHQDKARFRPAAPAVACGG